MQSIGYTIDSCKFSKVYYLLFHQNAQSLWNSTVFDCGTLQKQKLTKWVKNGKTETGRFLLFFKETLEEKKS